MVLGYGPIVVKHALGELMTGNFEEAIRPAKLGVELDPLDAWAWRELGRVLTYAGRFDEARRARKCRDIGCSSRRRFSSLWGARRIATGPAGLSSRFRYYTDQGVSLLAVAPRLPPMAAVSREDRPGGAGRNVGGGLSSRSPRNRALRPRSRVLSGSRSEKTWTSSSTPPSSSCRDRPSENPVCPRMVLGHIRRP
jgi:hypothetical protein